MSSKRENIKILMKENYATRENHSKYCTIAYEDRSVRIYLF